ncbi:MAG: hypothetical protein GQ525_05720 [Draconibacterium sp.]|nr:hypothetical protein [Draconibacterium sp.]
MNKCKLLTILIMSFLGVMFLSCTTKAPIQEHNLSSRKFQGIPSMAVSNEGRIWAVWYAGKTPAEDENNYVVVSTSGYGGKSWTEKFYIDPDGEGPFRAFDSELWMDPEGTLWFFWSETIEHDGENAVLWAKTNTNPDKEDSKWSEPRRITTGVMMCKPIVLSSGEWVLPVSTWRETDKSAKVVVSADKGKTFSIRGGCNVPKEVRDYDEHMIVERNDKSLWMLVRTKYGIGESISNDQGKTWSALVPSSIQQPSARFFIKRLSSGNLLLVKHGPIKERIGRSHLTAYLSKDDGYNWLGGLLLDERNGVSYPDGQQIADGTIYISYDYSRREDREILMTTFTEDDVIEGDTESPTVSLRMIISKYPSLVFDSKKVFIHEITVKIISQLKDSEIRYTNDGTEPNQNSLLYTGPFNVSETTNLKIKEFTPDGLDHPVYEARYTKQKPIEPTSEIINISGLKFEYFEFPESIDSLVDLQKYKPTKNGETDRFAYPVKTGKLPEYFGLKFSGYIEISMEDVYSFSVASNDGASLFIDDKLVVDNDGKHGTTEKAGGIALQKGLHKIELSYFQAGGGKYLEVLWEGSGFEKQEIPASVLFHK